MTGELAELRPGEINISKLVDEFASNIWGRAEQHLGTTGCIPTLAIYSDSPYPTGRPGHVQSYIQGLERAGAKTGVRTIIEAGLSVRGIQEALMLANPNPSIHGTLFTLPLASVERHERPEVTRALYEFMIPEKDADGILPVNIPATAQAGLMILRSVNRDPTIHVHLRGQGHVGQGLKRLLERRGYNNITTSDIDTPEAEVRSNLGRCAALFSLTGHAEGLGIEAFGTGADSKKIMVSVGLGKTPEGKLAGDFAPSLLTAASERGWLFTTFRPRSVNLGALATLIPMSHAVAVAKRQKAA